MLKLSNLPISTVLGKGMIPAIRRREIYKARILSRKERLDRGVGTPDILLTSESGKTSYIGRKEVVDTFTYLSGKKIKLFKWKSEESYYIKRNIETPALAMCIPKRIKLKVGKQITNSANRLKPDYIVCATNENGKIVAGTIEVISNDMFKKQYQLLPNEKKKGGKGKKKESEKVIKNTWKQERQRKQEEINVKRKPERKEEINLGKREMKVARQTNKVEQTTYKYRALARLYNNMGQLVGYKLQGLDGNEWNVTIEQMKVACGKHLVSNVMLTGNENGAYLRGNGERLEDLPKYMI